MGKKPCARFHGNLSHGRKSSRGCRQAVTGPIYHALQRPSQSYSGARLITEQTGHFLLLLVLKQQPCSQKTEQDPKDLFSLSTPPSYASSAQAHRRVPIGAPSPSDPRSKSGRDAATCLHSCQRLLRCSLYFRTVLSQRQLGFCCQPLPSH